MSVRKLKRSKTKKVRPETSLAHGALSPKQLIQLGLQHHYAGNLLEAEKAYQLVIASFPDNAEAYNNLGALYHGQGKLDTAAAQYSKALELEPHYPEALTNFGLLLHDQGKLDPAAALFRRILEAQPNHAAALTNLGLVLHKQGRLDEATANYQQVLASNPQDFFALNNLALILKEQGKLEEAAQYFRRVIDLNPRFVEALNNLGLVYQAQGRLDEALLAFEKSLSLNGRYLEARKNLGNLLLEKGDLDNAYKAYEQILKYDANDKAVLCNLGILYKNKGQQEEAVACFRKAIAVDPRFLVARSNLAEILEKLNKVPDAYSEALAGLALEPGNVPLAVVAARCERRNKAWQQAIKRLTSIDLNHQDLNVQRQIHFELGYIYDAVADSAQAYAHFAAGNRASQRLSGDIDKNKQLNHIDALYGHFSRHKAPPPEVSLAYKGEDLVFLVGFPRSGTTLLDQILDSHPRIQTMEEKNIVGALEKKLCDAGDNFTASWQNLTAGQIVALQQEYLREVQSHIKRAPQSAVLVDKFPLNIIRTALIQKIFPQAKFLLAIRHPCDACLSAFMQDFKINVAMANFFTLEDTVSFYEKVMGLWQTYAGVLPIQYHTVRYEDLIVDFENEVGNILKFLGVEWHDAALKFNEHATRRGLINTPSYHQVTQSLYQSAKDRWRRYETYLAPFQKRLAPFIEYYGY